MVTPRILKTLLIVFKAWQPWGVLLSNQLFGISSTSRLASFRVFRSPHQVGRWAQRLALVQITICFAAWTAYLETRWTFVESMPRWPRRTPLVTADADSFFWKFCYMFSNFIQQLKFLCFQKFYSTPHSTPLGLYKLVHPPFQSENSSKLICIRVTFLWM